MPTPRNAQREEAYGQLVPLEGDALLLPNAAVIEVRGLEGLRVRTAPPGWLLGQVAWREHELPVLSLEGLMGRGLPARSRRSRLLVINSVGTGVNNGLLALVCQGYPHLTALNRTALQPLALQPGDPDELVLARVRVANTQAIIPDLDAIEAKVAQALGAATETAADWSPASLQ
jgi:chemosensory pili system protein ChpC